MISCLTSNVGVYAVMGTRGTEVKVDVGASVEVDIEIAVSAGKTLADGVQEAKINTTRKTVTMFFVFMNGNIQKKNKKGKRITICQSYSINFNLTNNLSV